MANGFSHALDAPPWQPPRQISLNGGGKHIHPSPTPRPISSTSSSSSLSRKPLPLSLFGEQDDDEEEEVEEEAAISIDPTREIAGDDDEDDDEFGEFESVATATVVGADANGGGGKVADGKASSPRENGNGQVQIHDVGLGEFQEEQHSPAPNSNGHGSWVFTTPTSELMLAMHGIRAARSSQQPLGFREVSLGQKMVEDDWGDFAEPSVLKGGEDTKRNLQVDLIDLMSMSDDALVVPPGGDDDEEEKTSTDLLAGNGTFSLMDSQPDRDLDAAASFEPKLNGFAPSWDFDHPSPGGVEKQEDLDLFSTAPVPQQEVAPLDSLPTTTTTTDLLWNTNSSSSRDVDQDAVPVSLLELDQDVPAAKSLDGETILEAEAQQVTTGHVADDLTSWEFDVPATKLENISFSRSVSLPHPKPDAPGGDSASAANHQRSRSSGGGGDGGGGFRPSFTAIAEWSPFEEFATSNGAVQVSSKATAKQQEDDRFESLWDTGVQDPATREEKIPDAAANSDISDLLSLDWSYNAVLTETSTDKAEANATDNSATEEMKDKYLESWTMLARACAAELKLGLDIWQRAVSGGCSTKIISIHQGENYFTALTHIYRVCLLLSATMKMHASWLLPGLCDELLAAMDESRSAWSELEEAAAAAAAVESLRRLETSLRGVDDPSSLPPSSSRCALSLLPLDSLPDVPLVVWDDRTYFLPVANLWANRVSRSSPMA